MKILLTAVLLWSGMFMTQLDAQNFNRNYRDSLNIYNQDEIYARVICRDIHKLIKEPTYQDLVTSFIDHLESVKDRIPEYANYQIKYYLGASLKVEEIEGVTKYRLENDRLIPALNQNIAYLTDGELQVLLYFNELEDLMSQNYGLTINNAFSKIKDINGFKKYLSRSHPKLYNYSYSENRLIKQVGEINSKRKFGFVTSASVGLFKGLPIYEVSWGCGFFTGPRKRLLIFVSNSTLLQYDKESDEMLRSQLIELGYYIGGVTVKVGVPYRKRGRMSNVTFRLATNFYIAKGLSLGIQLNYTDYPNQHKIVPGVSVRLGI